MDVVVLEPHGLCAGVNAAIARALKLRDVYCLHELVHNEIVIDELKALGFTFVDRLDDVPVGATVVFSAHGVSPQTREHAKARRLKVVDTTCPFVNKVHAAVHSYAKRKLPIVIIGDPSHAEVQGLVGEAGGSAIAIKPGSGHDALPGLASGSKIAVVSQTTMNSDDVTAEIAALKKHYLVETMAEVCPATKSRQDAIRAFAASAHDNNQNHAVLVLGSRKSSNSKRLAEVANACGLKAFLAGTMDEVRSLDLAGISTLAVTSGASTPERFFTEAVRFLKNVPQHVAIIMDGNGRWATRQGKNRGEGHRAGAKTLEQVLNWCGDRGIQYLTVYAFSTENWKRPKKEVDGLMSLFVRMLKSKESSFIRNHIRFRMIGRRGDLSAKLLSVIESLERKTAAFDRQFVVAISYGGRAEIIDAANAAMRSGMPLTEETFRQFMYAPDIPDPDLVIRTSGELRTSNFLLWETAYSEYYFTDTLWPDFTEGELDKALASYAARHRRRGGV